MLVRELLEPGQAAVGPGRKRPTDLGLERRPAREEPGDLSAPSVPVGARGSAKRPSLGVAPDAEVDHERRHAALALGAVAAGPEEHGPDDHASRRRERDGEH
jgi:hypothetical protein